MATSKLSDFSNSYIKKELCTHSKGNTHYAWETPKSWIIMHGIALYSAYSCHTCLKSVIEPEGVVRNTKEFYTAPVRQY